PVQAINIPPPPAPAPANVPVPEDISEKAEPEPEPEPEPERPKKVRPPKAAAKPSVATPSAPLAALGDPELKAAAASVRGALVECGELGIPGTTHKVDVEVNTSGRV